VAQADYQPAGYSSASAAISIAVNAALRATAGMMPRPTARLRVPDSAADTAAIPPAKKQSSASHSSSKAADSARCVGQVLDAWAIHAVAQGHT
jgi:hypothetical protein